ncbi:MAG TPA: hypothetical protein V6C72_01450, partial [Chroococcales cyanobacterium]
VGGEPPVVGGEPPVVGGELTGPSAAGTVDTAVQPGGAAPETAVTGTAAHAVNEVAGGTSAANAVAAIDKVGAVTGPGAAAAESGVVGALETGAKVLSHVPE